MANIPVIVNSEHFINSSDDDNNDNEDDESDNENEPYSDDERDIDAIENLPWFHGALSRNAAEGILLSNGKEGTYLLRSSASISGQYSVDVRCQSSVKHFTLEYKSDNRDRKRYIFGLGHFETLKDLLEHFDCQPVLGSVSGNNVILKSPYPRHIEEPISYEEIWTHIEGRGGNGSSAASSEASSAIPDLHIASKEGYLTKRGAIHKNWKKRWFVLQKNWLSYFKKKESATPIRVINLKKATDVSEYLVKDNKPNCFGLSVPSRTFYFYSDSQLEAKQWMKMLQWKVDYYKGLEGNASETKQEGNASETKQEGDFITSSPRCEQESSNTVTAPSSKF